MTLLVRNSRHPGSEGAVSTKDTDLCKSKLAEGCGSVDGVMFRARTLAGEQCGSRAGPRV